MIGWYHSHPGYGCWLSGIDVSTQMLNQNYQEPFVAIVIDPIRTISSGKVNIGAFRTYPKVYYNYDCILKFNCSFIFSMLMFIYKYIETSLLGKFVSEHRFKWIR